MFIPSRASGSSSRKRTSNRTTNTTSVSGKDILLRAQLEREARQQILLEKKATLILQKHCRLFIYRASVYKDLIENFSPATVENNIYLKEHLSFSKGDNWIFKFENFFHCPYLKALLNNASFISHLDILAHISFSYRSLYPSIAPMIDAISIIYQSIDYKFAVNGNEFYLEKLNEALRIDRTRVIKNLDILFTFEYTLTNDQSSDFNYSTKYAYLIDELFYKHFATTETLFFGIIMGAKFARFFKPLEQSFLNECNFKILNLHKNGLDFDRVRSDNILTYNGNLGHVASDNLIEELSSLMFTYPAIKNTMISIWNGILKLVPLDQLHTFTYLLTKNKELISKLIKANLCDQVFLLVKVIFDKYSALFTINPINSFIVFNCYAFLYLLHSDRLHTLADRNILTNLKLINDSDVSNLSFENEMVRYKLLYFLKNTSELSDDLRENLKSYYSFFLDSNNVEFFNNKITELKANWPIEFYIFDRTNSYVASSELFFTSLIDRADNNRIENIINQSRDDASNTEDTAPVTEIFLSSFKFRKNLWKKILEDSYADPTSADILLKVDRKNFFHDVMYHLNGNLGTSFAVEYKEEQGRGYGLKKDFLSEASKLFFYDLNLFDVCGNGDGLIPNKEFLNHSVLENLGVEETSFTNKQLVKNAGKIMAFLLLEGFTIPYKFSYSFWRKFLLTLYFTNEQTERTIYKNEFIDLQFDDYELYSNFAVLFKLNDDELRSLGLYMEYEGIELVANGNNIPVCQNNLQLYIKQITDLKLNNKGVETFMESFIKGFKLVIQDELKLKVLSSFIYTEGKEISLIVNGNSLEKFPLDDFIANLQLQGYTQNDTTIKDLLYILRNEFTNDQLIKFFHFITSLKAPPFNGFGSLNPLICISKITDPGFVDSEHHLPSSSTCFNLLRLPNYEHRATLLKKLSIAIEDNSGFNLA